MSNTFVIKDATRQGIKPLIGVYGESGCGKTYSALLLARGFVGPSAKIVMCDSESGRGSLYADVLPGGYKTLELTTPFSPRRYIEAIEAIEASGAAIGIIDSASHEWEGIGGVLDMAGDSEASSGKAGLHNWKMPKLEHAKFMLRMLQSSIPWIVCLRAKYKSRQTKGTQEMADNGAITRNQIGKTVILKDDHTSPIQAEDFIYEMTAHFEVMPDHTIHLTKQSHPDLGACFPADYKEPIGLKHGELVAAWANGGAAAKKPSVASPDVQKAKSALWNLVKPKFATVQEFEQHCLDNNLMTDDEKLSDLSAERLQKLTEKMKGELL